MIAASTINRPAHGIAGKTGLKRGFLYLLVNGE